MNFKIGIETIGLAGQQGFEFAPRDFLFQMLERGFSLRHHAFVTLGFTEREFFEVTDAAAIAEPPRVQF